MRSIYALLDPRDGSTRYVGQTGNATMRLGRHLSAARQGKSSPVARWVAGLLREGVRPVLRELATVEASEASRREMETISTLRGHGAPLLNVRGAERRRSRAFQGKYVAMPMIAKDRADLLQYRLSEGERHGKIPKEGPAALALYRMGVEAWRAREAGQTKGARS